MTDQTEKQETSPMFRLQKMYIKDLSFENPNAPAIYLARNQELKVDFNLKLQNRKIDSDHWEVSIFITAKVMDKNSDDNVMFILEIDHAAVFLLKNIPKEHLARILAVDCPTMLFPFTRQVVCQTSVDGGFVPFLMEPINFLALFENAIRNQEQKH